MAILGGIVLSALVLLVCLSVLGRELNGFLHGPLFQGSLKGMADWLIAVGVGPVNGDFELVEAGMAFTIFAFLPYCQVTAGHASVDIFTNFLPMRVQKVLRMLVDILFAVMLVIVAMKLNDGMASKMRSGTTTFLLQFPIWWGYAVALVGAVLAAATAVYMAVVRVIEVITGRQIAVDDLGAAH